MRQIQLGECIGGITDFTLAAHKDQDISRSFSSKFIHGIENRLKLVTVDIISIVHHGAITHFDRIGSPRDFDNGRIIEMTRETLRVNGRRRNDHFQIGTLRQ